MERGVIVGHLKKKRKIVAITFLLLIIAFLENLYLSCMKAYNFPWCEMGWIYICLALVLVAVAYIYRK